MGFDLSRKTNNVVLDINHAAIGEVAPNSFAILTPDLNREMISKTIGKNKILTPLIKAITDYSDPASNQIVCTEK